MGTTIISDIIRERMERGLADLLLTVADHFYSLGAGLESEAATHPGLRDLLSTLEQRYQAEVAALRPRADPKRTRDEQTDYLLGLPNQANPEPPDWLRAYAERVEALGDVTPIGGAR